jgi:hypothetical protein
MKNRNKFERTMDNLWDYLSERNDLEGLRSLEGFLKYSREGEQEFWLQEGNERSERMKKYLD